MGLAYHLGNFTCSPVIADTIQSPGFLDFILHEKQILVMTRAEQAVDGLFEVFFPQSHGTVYLLEREMETL